MKLILIALRANKNVQFVTEREFLPKESFLLKSEVNGKMEAKIWLELLKFINLIQTTTLQF